MSEMTEYPLRECYVPQKVESIKEDGIIYHTEGISMSNNIKTYDSEFKKHVVLEVLNSDSSRQLKPIAMKYGVAPSTLRLWRDLYIEYGDDAFDRNKRKASKNNRIKELEKRNAELEEEIEILKKAAAFLADVGRK